MTLTDFQINHRMGFGSKPFSRNYTPEYKRNYSMNLTNSRMKIPNEFFYFKKKKHQFYHKTIQTNHKPDFDRNAFKEITFRVVKKKGGSGYCQPLKSVQLNNGGRYSTPRPHITCRLQWKISYRQEQGWVWSWQDLRKCSDTMKSLVMVRCLREIHVLGMRLLARADAEVVAN